MNLKACFLSLVSVGLLLVCAPSQAQTNTAFTYQGSLIQNGTPASGSFDFQFALRTNSTTGNAITTITNLGVNVTGGLFTATLDFSNAFNGTPYWLAVGVRPNGETGLFTSLAGTQPVTATPYALYAPSAGTVSGVLTSSNLPPNVALLNSSPTFTGTVTAANFVGDGSGLSNLPSSSGNGNYLFAYDTTIQSFSSSPSTFQLVNFNNPGVQINGWTYSPIGPSRNFFTAGTTGLYLIQYQAELSGTAGRTISFNSTLNNLEIAGSQAAATLGTNGVTSLSKSFFANVTASQVIRLQFTTDNLSATLQPGGTGTTRPSVSLTIIKVN